MKAVTFHLSYQASIPKFFPKKVFHFSLPKIVFPPFSIEACRAETEAAEPRLGDETSLGSGSKPWLDVGFAYEAKLHI